MFVLPLTRSPSRSASRAFSQRAFDRLFDESIDSLLRSDSASAPARTPALDVVETDKDYVLRFDVPGASKDQLQVTVEGRRVSIATAEQAAQDTPAGERVLYRERTNARYARTVVLPADIDHAASLAKFDNGVLMLTLPKVVASGAKKIDVN